LSTILIAPTPLTKHRHGENLFESENPKFQEYRTRWEQQPLNFEPGEFPLFIDLETTNVCNFKCTFCSNQFIPSEQFGFIEEDLVYKVIDEGKENGLYGLKFNVRGEPTLHKKLPDFIRYAVDAGLVDVYFNTNASKLTEELAVKVIEAGLTRITFSFEGYTKDYYERIRVKGDFDEIVGNIRRFHELRKKLGSSTPRIRISGVLLPEMKPYLSEYINFWKPYADQVSTNDWIQEDVNLHALPTKYKADWACATLWQRMAIWWDGTILPCNQDYLADDLCLGNLRDTTLKEAWLSPLHNKMRDAHKAGNSHLFDKCSTCSYRDQQISQYQGEMKVVAIS
jgi:MoaA/NifB/PqqE/SkfB family radical SAM enzyme